MARNPQSPQNPTKKHLARLEREKRNTRLIMIASIIVLVLVIGVIIYGILNETVLKDLRSVAVVNSERITAKQFVEASRYARYGNIRQAQNYYQFAQMFGGDPSSMASFAGQLSQLNSDMDPEIMGDNVINQLVDDRLIRQEAARRGITVSTEDVEKGMEEAFGFFANGTRTPTATLAPLSTSTLSTLQMTLIPPTPTATITPTATLVPTSEAGAEATQPPTAAPTATVAPTEQELDLEPSPTVEPTPSPTPYTREGYEQLSKETLDDLLSTYNISEDQVYKVIELQIFRERLQAQIVGDMPRTEEQVWALHILVGDEQSAQGLYDRLQRGEDWGTLASQYSIDTSNKDKGGDLGWFGKGAMVAEFEQAAFDLEVGETSQPVQTSFGWHLIRVLGHEDRPLADDVYQQKKETKFQEWLAELRTASTIEILDFWKEISPSDPVMPEEIVAFIEQVQNAANASGELPALEP